MFSQVPPKKSAAKPEKRRLPVQARSRKRYEAILEVAARTFADVGFEAATMEGIAEGAETSIGSVYQFFPHKAALFDALAQQCLERSRTFFDGLIDEVTADTAWEDVVDAAVDGFALLHERDPAFRATVKNFQLYGTYAERDSELNRYFVRRLVDTLARRAPHVDRAQLKLCSVVVVQVVSAMLFMSEQSPKALAAATLGETKLLVRRYLAPVLKRPRAR